MFSPNSQLLRKVFLSFFLLYSLIRLQAQCDPPDQLPTVLCVNAPLTCINDACYTTDNEDDFGWEGWCGNNTAIHNPQYFMLIVTEDIVHILIHVDDCDQGVALQSAIVTSCNWQPCPGNIVPCEDILDCDPGTPVGGTMDLLAAGLTIGDSLWLVIDGSSGAECQYTIEFAAGIFEPLIDEEINEGMA